MAAPNSAAPSPATCVLWHAPGTSPAEELLGALRRKGIAIVVAAGPYAALAEVGRLARESPRTPVVLLLAEPGRLTAAAAVVELARARPTRVTCWVYDPSADPRLRGLVEGDLAPGNARGGSRAQPANRVAPGVRTTGGGPGRGGPGVPVGQATPAKPAVPRSARQSLRLAEDQVQRSPARADAEAAGGPDRGPAGQRPAAPILTQEELAMLLAEDDPA